MAVSVTPEVPGAIPVFGHLLPIARGPLAFLQRASTYGDVVKVRLGGRSAYLVNAPALVREVLHDSDRFTRGTHYEAAKEVVNISIATTDGPYHRRQRRMIRAAFAHDRLASYSVAISRLASAQSQSWHDGQTLDLDKEFLALAVRVAAESLFSTPFSAQAAAEVERILPQLLRGIAARAFDPTKLVGRLPLPANRRFDAACRRMHEVVHDTISAYRSHSESNGDLLSLLLAARDPETGQTMTDEQVADEAISVLIAGSETVSATLAWTSHLLSLHPAAQQRLHEEVDTVLGGAAPTADKLGGLLYARRVLTESMRLFPPAYLLTRTPTTQTMLGAHLIPAGAMVLYAFYGLHRDPSLFRDPETFDPDRWLPERAADVTPPAFLPFSSGVHRCVGEGFAWMEALIVLAEVAAHWTLHPVPGHRVRGVPAMTLRPNRLPITLRRR